MTKTNSLYDFAEKNDLEIIETTFPVESLKGLYFDNIILLDKDIETQSELRCILAEELGHFETSNGIILNQKDLSSIKQENRARRWAHKKLISLHNLIECVEIGCRDKYDMIDHLEVTEAFFDEAIKHYYQIHGQFAVVDEFVIYFEPFGIMKMIV